MSYAYMDYGNRVGFWRLLELFDKHNIRCTPALNVAVLDHYPEIRDAMVERDWDFMSHGVYNTRYLWGATEEEERAFYQDTIDTIRRHTGKSLKGMLGPALTNTDRTPDLMAEAGLIYHTDWFHDDQPFPMKVKQGRLHPPCPTPLRPTTALPTCLGFEADYLAQIIKDQFDVLYQEGQESGRVMCIALHPYWSGQAHRIRYLDDAFSYILSHDGVWQATADQIADYYLEHYYDQVVEYTGRAS